MVVRDNTLSRMSGESLARKTSSGCVSFVMAVVMAVVEADVTAAGFCIVLEASLLWCVELGVRLP